MGAGLDSGVIDPRLARLNRFGGSASTTVSKSDVKEASSSRSLNEKLLAADPGVEIKSMVSPSV